MKNNALLIKTLVVLILIFNESLIMGQAPCPDEEFVSEIIFDRPPDVKPADVPFHLWYVDALSGKVQVFERCSPSSQVIKNITFVHGLAGNATSWEKPWRWTNSVIGNPAINVDYEGWEQGFHSSSLRLNQQIGSKITSGVNQAFPNRCSSEDYVIAHSQGGIVARYLDRQWAMCELYGTQSPNCSPTFGNRKYYGLATFGTPHAGAHIGLTQDEHHDFVAKMAQVLYFKEGDEVIFNLTNRWYVPRNVKNALYDFMESGFEAFVKNFTPLIL